MKNPKIKTLFEHAGIILFTIFFGLVFAFLSYNTLLSSLEIQQDIVEFLKALIYNEEDKLGFAAKAIISLKILNILLSFILMVFSFSLFSSGLTGLFYRTSAKKHGYEEVGHGRTLKKTVEWQLYRYSSTFLPLLVFILAAGMLFLLGVTFFNWIITGMGISTGLTFFILAFTGFNFMFFLSLAVLASLLKTISLGFGTEIAVSEPELENKIISGRSKRIISQLPGNFLLLFVYTVFVILLLVQAKSLNLMNASVFSAFFILNSIAYAGIKYLKTNAYINSLLNYHEKIKLSLH